MYILLDCFQGSLYVPWDIYNACLKCNLLYFFPTTVMPIVAENCVQIEELDVAGISSISMASLTCFREACLGRVGVSHLHIYISGSPRMSYVVKLLISCLVIYSLCQFSCCSCFMSFISWLSSSSLLLHSSVPPSSFFCSSSSSSSLPSSFFTYSHPNYPYIFASTSSSSSIIIGFILS